MLPSNCVHILGGIIVASGGGSLPLVEYGGAEHVGKVYPHGVDVVLIRLRDGVRCFWGTEYGFSSDYPAGVDYPVVDAFNMVLDLGSKGVSAHPDFTHLSPIFLESRRFAAATLRGGYCLWRFVGRLRAHRAEVDQLLQFSTVCYHTLTHHIIHIISYPPHTHLPITHTLKRRDAPLVFNACCTCSTVDGLVLMCRWLNGTAWSDTARCISMRAPSTKNKVVGFHV